MWNPSVWLARQDIFCPLPSSLKFMTFTWDVSINKRKAREHKNPMSYSPTWNSYHRISICRYRRKITADTFLHSFIWFQNGGKYITIFIIFYFWQCHECSLEAWFPSWIKLKILTFSYFFLIFHKLLPDELYYKENHIYSQLF